MDPNDRSVKINQEEIESLSRLKSLLDHKEAVSRYAEKYQKLGWVLAALDAQDGTDLEVDFRESPAVWIPRLWEPDLMRTKINLGVSTGKQSRILALEVAKERGESILDQYGEWRSECIAVLGNSREQHFYAWGPEPFCDSVAVGATPEFRWFGEGRVALVPPSSDPETGETWRWLYPPWEKNPQSPSLSLGRFLQDHVSGEPQTRPAINLSWQEVYCLVSPHEPLLQALFAAPGSMADYYQGILKTAAAVGIKAPEVLRSLLWHAPRGDAPQHPEIWDSLEKLVLEAQNQPGTEPPQGEVPFELFLERALSLAREQSCRNSGQAMDKPGPPCSLKRSQAKAPISGAAPRHPFSARKKKGDSG